MRRIEFSDKAEKMLLSFDKPVRQRIIKFFRERVETHPDPITLAEPLAGPMAGLHRFRIGDYRAICDFQGNQLIILVLQIGHRGAVYR
jgi:mRNA interferase RelE/StbE